MATRVLIKYKDKFIGLENKFSISEIILPKYNEFDNQIYDLSFFITLLITNNLYNNYLPECIDDMTDKYFLLTEMKFFDKDCIYYDLDNALKILKIDEIELPDFLKLIDKSNVKNYNVNQSFIDMINCYTEYKSSFITLFNPNNKQVLHMFSAGKDSLLSAYFLEHIGYNVYLFHFDNGYMRDVDKPYLYYLETFNKLDKNIFFEQDHSNILIKDIFLTNFSKWQELHGNNVTDYSIDSEIRCLCCRCAMYEVIIKYAILNKINTISEGARKCQLFMIEQEEMINRFKALAHTFNIEIKYPVLNIDDDDEEKRLLLAYGSSSKTWESKCLLGRKAMNKTIEDKKIILDYYDKYILPNMIKRINNVYLEDIPDSYVVKKLGRNKFD